MHILIRSAFCLVFISFFFHIQTAAAFQLMGDKTPLFEKRSYQSHTGLAAFDYYLLLPKNYDPKKKYPLVLTLHGASGHSIGAYILAHDKMRDAYPAFVLVPQVRAISWSLPLYTDLSPSPSQHIIKLISRLEKEVSIDLRRVYVTGYSVGGYGTFEIVAENPTFFAAAAPLCGGTDIADAPKLKQTPMWVFHGAQDRGIPVQKSRDIVTAMRQTGATPLYSEYPNVGHNVWDYAYRDMRFWQWLFSQARR